MKKENLIYNSPIRPTCPKCGFTLTYNVYRWICLSQFCDYKEKDKE